MKLHIASLILWCVVMASVPAIAQQNLYDNGPVNGQNWAWAINYGFTVSDSIQVNGPIAGIQFWAWLIPGDTITNVEVQIGANAFGNELFDGVVTLTQDQSSCTPNDDGFYVCIESGNFSGPSLNGNAWVTLGNANLPDGDLVYWDVNSGVGCTSPGCPSAAQENTIGTIPSEAFTLLGNVTTTCPWCGFTPEPGSIVLFGSGVLGLVGMLRLKRRS
jgi:hypothetical protein